MLLEPFFLLRKKKKKAISILISEIYRICLLFVQVCHRLFQLTSPPKMQELKPKPKEIENLYTKVKATCIEMVKSNEKKKIVTTNMADALKTTINF